MRFLPHNFLTSFGWQATVALGLFLSSLLLQHGLGLQPCPLCYIQRYLMLLIGAFSLLAAIYAPSRGLRGFYCLWVGLLSGVGLATAGRQLWLQSLPPEQLGGCLPDFAFLVSQFPLWDALTLAYQGSSDCANVMWTFLGLSISHWTSFFFAGMLVHCGYWFVRVIRHR